MTEPRATGNDPRLHTLLEWREKLIEAGTVSRSAFKEAHIRLVLRSGCTDADEIRVMLPGSVVEHAGEMSQLLQYSPGPEVSDQLRADDAVPQSGFARFAFGVDEHEIVPVVLRRSRDGDPLEVSWPPYAGETPCVLYRVVSSEGQRAYSPDNAELVAATALTSAVDARPLTDAVRHLQVWVNTGPSVAEALDAQPVLHAAGVVVGTLHDVDIHEEAGRVIGRWPAVSGVNAVHVYRVPAELAARDGPVFRIATEDQNLTGFVDGEADRGGRYLYRLRCEVEVDGVVRLSEAVERAIVVSAVCEPVTDLTLRAHTPDDGAAFDLSWTTPRSGKVKIFRTPAPPDAGAQDDELDETVLEQVGLSPDMQLTHPVSERFESGVGTTVMAGVPWPRGWNRAYFTPVTILDGRGRSGKAIPRARTGAITDVALMEYCNKQVLTFDWPTGAASVLVYITPKGYDPRHGLTGRSYEIALDAYEKYGGMRFIGNLPNGGCGLHLVPTAFSGGERVLGVPTSIEYRGLLRLWYGIDIERGRDGLPQAAMVHVRAEEETTGSPPFVLVSHPDRLPLSVNDGVAVDVYESGTDIGTGREAAKEFQFQSLTTSAGHAWVGDVRGLEGWIRLFANLPPERLQLLALIDPPVQALRLTPGAAGR